MWKFITSIFFCFSAFAQNNSLVSLSNEPLMYMGGEIVVSCEIETLTGKSNFVIDFKEGVATQIVGDQKYVYFLNNLSLEKKKGDKKGLFCDVNGYLKSVVNVRTGEEVKEAVINEGTFSLKSYLAKKDNKKFRAKVFNIVTDVKHQKGMNLKMKKETNNSTKCFLVKGGDEVRSSSKKNLASEYSTTYPKAHVDNSNRNGGKKQPGAEGPNQNPTSTSGKVIGQ